jgi:hypothetical protein
MVSTQATLTFEEAIWSFQLGSSRL